MKDYDAEDYALKKLVEMGFPIEDEDTDFIEQRVFLREFETIKEEQYW